MAYICDGVKQCPRGDDEILCNLTCPGECFCNGAVFICRADNINRVLPQISNKARKLDVSLSRFSNNTLVVGYYPYLAELILTRCSIEYVEPKAFMNVNNLLVLDLSYNRIHAIHKDTFLGLQRLVKLTLRGNNLYSIQNGGFRGIPQLKYIDLSLNVIDEFSDKIFSDLTNLNDMMTDSYVFCCLRPESVEEQNCKPDPDAFSSCYDLMKFSVMRWTLWIVSMMALFGNFGVIMYRVIFERQTIYKPSVFLILNLSISDFLTGIYLVIIAIADTVYKGNYILNEKEWRQSIICKFAGVLMTIASEASVNFILLIALDRFIAVHQPFKHRNITLKLTAVAVSGVWIFVTLLGTIPLVFIDYFSESFYTKQGVCLALPFVTKNISGWEYSMSIFVIYNSVVFIIIAVCQLMIYHKATGSSGIMSTKTRQDLTLARKLFVVVLTDFLCWIPIGVMGKPYLIKTEISNSVCIHYVSMLKVKRLEIQNL